jgi:hypothetical protein
MKYLFANRQLLLQDYSKMPKNKKLDRYGKYGEAEE